MERYFVFVPWSKNPSVRFVTIDWLIDWLIGKLIWYCMNMEIIFLFVVTVTAAVDIAVVVVVTDRLHEPSNLWNGTSNKTDKNTTHTYLPLPLPPH